MSLRDEGLSSLWDLQDGQVKIVFIEDCFHGGLFLLLLIHIIRNMYKLDI